MRLVILNDTKWMQNWHPLAARFYWWEAVVTALSSSYIQNSTTVQFSLWFPKSREFLIWKCTCRVLLLPHFVECTTCFNICLTQQVEQNVKFLWHSVCNNTHLVALCEVMRPTPGVLWESGLLTNDGSGFDGSYSLLQAVDGSVVLGKPLLLTRDPPSRTVLRAQTLSRLLCFLFSL